MKLAVYMTHTEFGILSHLEKLWNISVHVNKENVKHISRVFTSRSRNCNTEFRLFETFFFSPKKMRLEMIRIVCLGFKKVHLLKTLS